MRENIFSYGQFNIDSLISLSQSLRGQPCTCDVSQVPKAGSLNWVTFVSFDDGIEWVFRSPRSGLHTIVHDETAARLLVSEASTLRYLKARTSVPVPEVYSFSGSWDNDVGVPYILMSKARGRALSEYDWTGIARTTPGYPPPPCPLLPLSEEGRERVMSQLGTIMAHLSETRFEKIGSLFECPNGEYSAGERLSPTCYSGSYSVGECLSPPLVWQWRDSLEGIDRGPFTEESRYLDSLVSAFVSHAMELSLVPHTFFAPIPSSVEYPNWSSYRAAVGRWNDFVAIGDKVESSRNRLSFCIAGQFLREMISRLCTGSDTSAGNGTFTLSHPDLHLGNIFVDKDLNITCIIDWGSTSSGPLTELLMTPGFGSSTSPPSESLIAAFRTAFEKQQPQIEPSCWKKADMMWCFSRLIRMLSTQDYTLFRVLYQSVYKAEEVDIPYLFNRRAMLEDTKRLLAKLREDDLSEEDLKRWEGESLGSGKDVEARRAVARKLTVVSEINRGFVADKRLWRWIEAVFEQDPRADSPSSSIALE